MTSSTKLAILTAATITVGPGAAAQAVKPAEPARAAASLCPGQTFATVFAPFGDRALYTLVDGGSFEDGAAGWKLTGGAEVVEDNETAYVVGADDRHSLELAPGATATSPATCVAHGYKSARLFARALVARGDARGLRVQVIYTPAGGKPVKARSRKLKANGAWSPTRRLSLGHGRFQDAAHSGKAGKAGAVQFRFTVAGKATWRIDDVHVDPIMKR